MSQMYPSLRDWSSAASEAQARANARRALEDVRIDWIAAFVMAGVLVAFLLLLKAAIPVAT